MKSRYGCTVVRGIPRYRKDPLMTVCGKRGFPTEQEARSEVAACARKRAARRTHRREAAVYPCTRCWRWHMTSQTHDERKEH
jgi:hypothetical protein